MTITYEEAFASNISAWMRRAGLEHDKSRDAMRAERAKKIMGDSSRIGALFTVGAIIGSTRYKIDNVRKAMIFGAAVAGVLFKKVYNNELGDTATMLRAYIQNFRESEREEVTVIIEGQMTNLVKVIDELYLARTNDKARVSVVNVVRDAVRGKHVNWS